MLVFIYNANRCNSIQYQQYPTIKFNEFNVHTLVITAVSTWQVLQLAKARRPSFWTVEVGYTIYTPYNNDSRWSSMIHEISGSRSRQSHESHESHVLLWKILKHFETMLQVQPQAAKADSAVEFWNWQRNLRWCDRTLQDTANFRDGPFQNGQNRPSKFRRQARRPRALLSDRRQLPHLCRAQCSTARCYCNLL